MQVDIIIIIFIENCQNATYTYRQDMHAVFTSSNLPLRISTTCSANLVSLMHW